MKLQPEQTLSIFPYRAEFKDDFFELNAEWLEAYFLIEPYDLEVLRNPQEMILDEGGEIYVGAIDGDVVATFALTPRPSGGFSRSSITEPINIFIFSAVRSPTYRLCLLLM